MGGDLEATTVGLDLDSGIRKYSIEAKAPVEEHHQTSDIEEVLNCLPEQVDRQLPLHILRKIPAVLRAKKVQRLVDFTSCKLQHQIECPLRCPIMDQIF